VDNVLLISGNISRAINSGSLDEIYYLKNPHSDIQSQAIGHEFEILKKYLPSIKRITSINMIPTHKAVTFFGWNACDEVESLKVFKNAKVAKANRLFESVNFEKLKNFTQFRQINEPLLPFSYDLPSNLIIDNEVMDHLNWYFYETHLAKTYFEDRNGVIGKEYSTKLSSFLSTGRLDVRFLYNYIKTYEATHGSNKSTYWIIFELLWREFFYWSYQKHSTKFFSKNGLSGPLDFSPFKKDRDFLDLFKDDPFMLAVISELQMSGFVSNRFRQVFASSLINNYKLDWREGAYLFERFLIDYDVYSNYGNWQYLAGVGHDPRGKRMFDTLKQISTYDKNYDYIKLWTRYQSTLEIKNLLEKIYL